MQLDLIQRDTVVAAVDLLPHGIQHTGACAQKFEHGYRDFSIIFSVNDKAINDSSYTCFVIISKGYQFHELSLFG